MGLVVSMQLLKELVTVRLDEENVEATYRCDELGLGAARPRDSLVPEAPSPTPVTSEDDVVDRIAPTVEVEPAAAPVRRRRRRSGRRPGSAR
jgi:hypothetical protein